MDTPSTHTSPPAKNRQGCYGCTFIFCLLFLIGGAIPALLNLPGLQARFTGLETTALVSADLSCSWTDSNHDTITGYYYTYTFTISSGKVYQIKDTSCSSKPDAVNTYETIWYQPTDPTHFLTANAWTFDVLFFLGFAIPMLLFICACLCQLFQRLSSPTRSFPETPRG